MDDGRTRGREHAAFGALVSFLLAPVMAQGLWRPLVHFLGPSGGAGAITGAALALSAAIVVERLARVMTTGGLVSARAPAPFQRPS